MNCDALPRVPAIIVQATTEFHAVVAESKLTSARIFLSRLINLLNSH